MSTSSLPTVQLPLPIEQVDPAFGELLIKVVTHELPAVIIDTDVYDIRTKRQVTIERNEKCPCDSGLKYKKCCGV